MVPTSACSPRAATGPAPVQGRTPIAIYLLGDGASAEGRMALGQLRHTQPRTPIIALHVDGAGRTFATLGEQMDRQAQPWAWLVPARTLVFETLSLVEGLTNQGDMALCMSRPGGICLLSREVVRELADIEAEVELGCRVNQHSSEPHPVWTPFLDQTPRALVDLSEALNGGVFDEGLTWPDTAWERDAQGLKLIRWYGRTPYLRHGYTRVLSRASSLDFSEAPELMHCYYHGQGLWGLRLIRELRLRLGR